MAKNTKTSSDLAAVRRACAQAEYERLVDLYRSAGADELKMKIDDNLIRKTAELYGTLEAIKDLPSVTFKQNNHNVTVETAAGKSRVKYMAQYTTCMMKLNKDLLGVVTDGDDDDLEDYEE
ncbi:MAG: hypothetical protein ACLSUU_06205 [Christensenellales bacterium]